MGNLTTADAIFVENVDSVYAYARRRVNSETVAEDITAEVFCEAVRYLTKRRQSDPLPWLYGIARRKIADHHRGARSKREVSLTESVTCESEDRVAEDWEARHLRGLVEGLPKDQREVVLLRYVEDMTSKQIAIVMGRSVFAVNSLLQRARKAIFVRGRAFFDTQPEEK